LCEISTTSMRGSSSRRTAGACQRFGPAHCTGEARSEKCGSVRTLTWPICTSAVACPIQVTEKWLVRPRMKPRSGTSAARSILGAAISSARRSRCQRKNSPNERGIQAAGSMFWKPSGR
jgi:hypothetical protein